MLTRRELLKYGVTAATLSGFSPRLARGDDGGGGARTPFKTEPFVQSLPFPPVKQTFATGSGCVRSLPTVGTQASPGTHQYSERPDFDPVCAYAINVSDRDANGDPITHIFHPAIPPTRIFGYDGIFPGPTFQARYGQPIMVRFFNNLDKKHQGFGIPSISTHLHNGHTASESDGFPGNFHDSGTYWDNLYPNILNGFSTDSVNGGGCDCMGTLWYHDHRQDFTAQNVYAGLAGFYLLYDTLDCNDETDRNGLQLPSGDFDVPMVFADKVFDADGQVVFDFFNLDGILGDRYTVNGAVQPFLNVKPRKYRFRLLDAGPSRFYAFALSDGTQLIQIANDGNLLAAPVLRSVVTCGVAERHDVIIDFSKYLVGDKVYLMNRAEQTDGRGPTGELLTPGDPLVEFRVTSFDKNDVSQIPSTLRTPPPLDLSHVAATRTWEFNRSNGGWQVNGKFFEVNDIRAHVKCNTREIWTLKNGGGGWSHPVHIHFEEYRTLSRNGRTPQAFEDRKDVAVLGPGEEVQVCFQFRDFLGRYPMHCHNVVHEDHAMMIRFDIEP
jgi:FtsP/CotA-like multicopper oxidase with cupredoxin domain